MFQRPNGISKPANSLFYHPLIRFIIISQRQSARTEAEGCIISHVSAPEWHKQSRKWHTMPSEVALLLHISLFLRSPVPFLRKVSSRKNKLTLFVLRLLDMRYSNLENQWQSNVPRARRCSCGYFPGSIMNQATHASEDKAPSINNEVKECFCFPRRLHTILLYVSLIYICVYSRQ